MRVQILREGEAHERTLPELSRVGASEPITPDAVGFDLGWRPDVVLGATAPGGLQLPPARPTAAWLYAPRGVYLDDDVVVAADTGNHRVLIWNGVPARDGVPADVVLGQPDEHSEGPWQGPTRSAFGMNLPTGVLVTEGRLVVADAWHHRVLVWSEVPSRTGTLPDMVIGQPDLIGVQPNRGGEPDAATLYWPFGIAVVDGRFYVADTHNRRVLVWRDGLPLDGRPADVVLGQPTPGHREENRGGEAGPASFRWPHAFAGTGDGGILVADAGNHRVLRWDRHPEQDMPADGVLGQPDFTGCSEFPYVSQAGRLRFPYGLAALHDHLFVADTANNRVLEYAGPSAAHNDVPLTALGQHTLADGGENRWDQVAADTLCWPYGIALHAAGSDDVLAVADSGNNRVVLWRRPAAVRQ
jgi:hypothetical protein